MRWRAVAVPRSKAASRSDGRLLMAEALKKLKKLRGRNLAELRVRGAQTLAAYAERTGLSARTRVPPDGEFLKALNAANLNGHQSGRGAGTAGDLLEHFRRR